MIYRVIYAPSFLKDIDKHVTYLEDNQVTGFVIERWYNAFFKKVTGLDFMPHRFPVDAWASRTYGRETRKLNVGKYLVFYQVDEDRRCVDVVAFIHGSTRKQV